MNGLTPVRLVDGRELLLAITSERLHALMRSSVGRVGVQDVSTGSWLWLTLTEVVAVGSHAPDGFHRTA